MEDKIYAKLHTMREGAEVSIEVRNYFAMLAYNKARGR